MPEGSGKALWTKIYNDSMSAGDSKEIAAKKAWSGLKKAGWSKNASGEWIKGKSEFASLSMVIVKTSLDKDGTIMRWRSVNSDTEPDLYDESMSPELFKDFTDRIDNKVDVPEPFKSLICEEEWCGGLPYVSLAHYRSGTGKKNVPGEVESVYVDGKMLKSTGILYKTPLGYKTFEALNRDLYKKKSDGTPEVSPEERVRVSIGFLDLEHKHILDDGAEKLFSRTDVGQVCQLCSTGIGRKIYTKGQLVHLAFTRVPVNPRTLVEVDKSMGIMTKKDDAESIIGKDLVEELEEKSLADDVLVVKAEGQTLDFPDELMDKCYDPNTDSFDQDCIDELMMGHMPALRNSMNAELKSDTVSKSVTKSESWGDEPASSYLVVGDREHPTTWHLPVKKNGKLDTGLMGAAKAALTSNHRGKAYAGPNKSKALAKLGSLYRSQGMDFENKSITEESTMAEKELKKKVKPEEVDRFDDEEGTENSAGAINQGKSKAKAMKEEENEQEDKKETPADEEAEDKKEKKSLMAKFSVVADKVLELRGAGASASDAEKILQPLLNEVGSTIEKSLKPSGDAGIAEAMHEMSQALRESNELTRQLLQENAVLKASQGKAASSGPQAFTPTARSLKIEKSAVGQQPVKKLSQIEQIARKSTGLPVEE